MPVAKGDFENTIIWKFFELIIGRKKNEKLFLLSGNVKKNFQDKSVLLRIFKTHKKAILFKRGFVLSSHVDFLPK
jgi:hypothetical protein